MLLPQKRLKRHECLNDARYLTCSCYQCLPLLGNDAIKDAFVEHLCLVQSLMKMEVYAWVIMPEHFHVIVRPCGISSPHHAAPCGTQRGTQTADHALPGNIPDFLRRLKGPFAQRVIQRWQAMDAPILKRLRDTQGKLRFWQTGGGYDRNLFSPEELQEKIHYIHANPVRRGLVNHPLDYPWSSARHFDAPTQYVGPVITRTM